MTDTPPADRPNVLMFCCDHLRADWLGCNGHPIVMTPQIDKLAYAGLNFQNAFSECPVCVPARRILMTGMGPYRINMNQNRDTQPFPEGPKLAEVMTRAGYQTFASGKLHTWPQRNRIGFEDVQLNEEGRRQGDLKKDDYDTYLEEQGYGHLAYTHGLGNNQYGLRLNPLPEKMTTTHWTARKAMEFIERRDPTRPFFLYTSFDKPHPPITPPAEYYDLYRNVDFPEPVMGDWLPEKLPSRIQSLRYNNNYKDLKDHPLQIQQSMRGFAAMITHIDSMVGVIMGQLREHGLAGNTWVIFTSDHGDQMFDHGNFAKGDFFTGSTNVPLIVCPPPKIRKEMGLTTGRTNHTTPAGLTDIMPTILEACQLPVPDNIEGQSLLPLIRDDNAPFRKFSFGNCNVVYGLCDGKTKYMWFSDDDIEFLFDQQKDPRDCHDLSDDPAYGEVMDTWRKRLVHMLEEEGDPHTENGKLKAIPVEWPSLKHQYGANIWNNRGLH